MSNFWHGDYNPRPQQSRGPGPGRGRRHGGQWRTENQGRSHGEGQYRSDYGHQHASTVSTGGRRGWGNGGGVTRGQGGGYGEAGGGGGEGGGRMTIRELIPHQPNTAIVGIVITKQSIHSFPDKKNPGLHRFKFAFTIRDSPSDYVNVTCWGSEAYIRSLVDSFKICDVVELRNVQILSKSGGESEERWSPWTSSGHQLNATEGHSTISLYTGWDYTDFTALAHIPLRPPNDYYPLSDILSSGQALEGSHINILAIVRHVSTPKQMTSRTGKPIKKCEVRLMDDACSSFTFTIWDEELIDLAQTWTPKENIIFVVDAKVNFNSYTNSMVASCDQKTIITTNPDCREAHQLYQYAQSLGDLGTGTEEEKEWTGNTSFTDISTITKVYSIEEVIRTQGSGKDNSFSGIVYALLMSLNIDNDPARVVSFRCTTCRMRAQSGSSQCSNISCPSHSSMFSTEPHFNMPIGLADHTAGLEGVRLTGKAAADLLRLTPEEFLNRSPEQRMALKHSLQLERYKIYFQSSVILGENRRPLVRVLSMDTAQPDEVVTYTQPRHT